MSDFTRSSEIFERGCPEGFVKQKISLDRVKKGDKLEKKLTVLGKSIRAERKALRLTQKELGDLAGTGFNFVSQLEGGKPTVRFDKVVAVLSVLGLQLSIRRGKEGVTSEL